MGYMNFDQAFEFVTRELGPCRCAGGNGRACPARWHTFWSPNGVARAFVHIAPAHEPWTYLNLNGSLGKPQTPAGELQATPPPNGVLVEVDDYQGPNFVRFKAKLPVGNAKASEFLKGWLRRTRA